MELLLDQYITLGACAGVLGILYLAWLSSGVISVAYSKTRQWSWKIFWEDLLKLLVVIGSMALFVLGANLLEWLVAHMGGDISVLANIVSVGAVARQMIKAGAGYASKAQANYEAFFSSRHSEETPLEIDPEKIDWHGISEDVQNFCKEVADAITPEHLQTEQQTEAEAALSEEEIALVREVLEYGLGAEVSPLSRILPDGDNDGGKGWQCSKYAWYLASGERMNYAPHPDYGPVNGNRMVDYLIQKLGWVECKKQDGAIFSYNTGQYGHTGIVKNAAQNLVSDANWTPLKVGTHYINLDAVGARYCCPRSQVVSTTNSAQKAPKNAHTQASEGNNSSTATPAPAKKENTAVSQDKPLIFHKGEKVVPLRKVDYDGRHLRQYDEVYYVVQDVEEGEDRVVLGARGQIWAAMRTEDVKKV